MSGNNKSMSEINTYYRKVDVIAAWEVANKVPYKNRLTYWFGDYGMDAPKYEHQDEIDGMYARIIAQGHPLLDGSAPAIYRQSEQYAHAHGELDAYHEGAWFNAVCARAIDVAIANCADVSDLKEAAGDVIAEHGLGRVAWVLASAIREKLYDGKLAYEHRQWAQAFPIPIEYRPSFALQSSSAVLDGFAGEALKAFDALGCLHTGPLREAESTASDKSSVMDRLREARKNPAPSSPSAKLDKGVPEYEI